MSEQQQQQESGPAIVASAGDGPMSRGAFGYRWLCGKCFGKLHPGVSS